MKRLVWGAIGVVVVASTALAVRRKVGGSTSAGVPADGMQVVRVVRRDVGSVVKATGVIKPRVGAEVRVGSRISGVVKRLFVQIGDTVAKGQLLATLDDRDLVSRRNEAAAALRQADADLRFNSADLSRKRVLLAANGISKSDAELAERASTVAEQQVARARASLDFATTQVEYARIVAPIAGVVASVSTQEGETVAASFAAPTFLTLLDPTRLEVWAYVDETDIGRIRMGQRALFTVDTYGDQEFEGRATAVYPKAEIRDNVVNYVTVVRFQPPSDRTLRPEMTTTVRIALGAREHALALPVGAVRWQDRRAYVLSSPRAGLVEKRWVTTGVRDERYWEIVAGVSEGDAVLVGNGVSTGGGES
ncbi:MAG: efflux RND transporter periplasmic adaptor subunit [Gemmatimonadaceae bacterium]